MRVADLLRRYEAEDLLRDRTRTSLWVILACVALFALADLGIPRRVFVPVYALKGLQVLLLLLVFGALRRPPRPWRTLAAAFATVNGTYVLMAAGDALKGHLETTPLLAVVCAMCAASILPWGLAPQLASVAVMEVGNLWTLSLTGRPLEMLIDPAASVTGALGVSVYVAYQFERYRRERERSEGILAKRARLEALRADVRVGVTSPASLTDALTLCAQVLVRHLPGSLACIWTLAANGALELQASAGADADTVDEALPLDTSIVGLVARRCRPHLSDVASAEAPLGDPTWLARHGLVAFAGHPLVTEGRLLGVVAIYAREPLGGDTLVALEAGAEAIAATIHRARAEEARARLLDELERANQLKSEFVSTMSHELRTPLNVINGYLDMLEDPESSDPSFVLARIRHTNRELLEMIEATLDLGRLEAARDRVLTEDVPLDVVWRDLASELATLPRHPDVRLRWLPVAPAILHTDRRKLKTIVKNLVGNALKFTRSGEVVVGAQCDAGTCVLTVRDSGIGIPAEHLPHIFEVFRQVDGSDRRAFGGVGLGLHIVQRFCDQLGGTVTVESEVARGTTFTVRLPLQAPVRLDATARLSGGF